MRTHARHPRVAGRVRPRHLGDLLAHPCPRTDQAFGEFTAVDAIDFDVAPGESFGFLGPERRRQDLDDADDRLRLADHRRARCAIMGMDPATDGPRIRARLGVVPQQDTLDTELTVRENLLIYGRYFGLSRAEVGQRADELLEFAQLTERAGDQVEPLSGGMKRRLTIARSLINEPDVLLLDEPTTGLDPQARHLLWDRLYRLKQRGVTLVLTTHYMDEAEQLCDRLVVMDKAKIVAEGSRRASSSSGTRPAKSPSCASRRTSRRRSTVARRPRRADRAPAGPGPAVRRRRRGGGRRRPRAWASSPRRCWSAARRSRTSSCG